MARKLPCRGCGEPRYPTRSATGEYVPTLCRVCRSSNLVHGRSSTYRKRGCRCDLCRVAYNAECRIHQAVARLRAGRSLRQCAACGVDFNPRANQILCSPACRKAQLGRYGDHRSRAAFWGVKYEQIDRQSLFDRDGWVCGICALPVDPTVEFPDVGSPTIDHVMPMSRGGGHVWANVQLAHFYCNTAKGNRDLELTDAV